eukprot:TRINITY_DN7517_c0_g1_i3.p1 TRINITY_DN7517_c0_g1~~TRINITY_DN7517_c0_g1_i3.p1  ORF type:complete len:459 (+),score=112.68 TRINITY_DN7517_c0_g1_i3:42-1418(+)
MATGPDAKRSKLQMQSFGDLLGAMSTQDFMEQHFQKKHLHVKRNRKIEPLFSYKDMLQAFEDNELAFMQDVNACRFDGEEKHNLNPCCEGGCSNEPTPATAKAVDKLFREANATLQFHQPQRFSPALQKLMYRMEQDFGCLVGANLYVTPAGCQGLAPHHDDIEAFVVQLEGKKKWKLYKPLEELAVSYSTDLPHEAIGKPIAEIELSPGDVLYFPRGQVHEAVASGEGHSTHVTISTYQEWSLATLMVNVLPTCITSMASELLSLRQGLPVSYLRTAGQVHGTNQQRVVLDQLRQVMQSDDFWNLLEEHLPSEVDRFAVDYTVNRLPPSVIAQEQQDVNPLTITADSVVEIQHEDHFRLVPEDEEGVVSLYHSMNNDPAQHMMGSNQQEPDDDEEIGSTPTRSILSSDASVLPAMAALMPTKDGRPNIRVGDLPLPEDTAIALCRTLAGLGLLKLVS